MPTRGGFAAFTERAKDVIVDSLREYLSLNFANVLKEMPQIERYGLAGQTTAESFVGVFTALPHEEQRIPFIAIMSAPGSERKLGIGRQVVHTFHDPDTGLPMVREAVGGDMNVIIEIACVDTNQRAEIVDIVSNFFMTYMEQSAFTFLGDALPDKLSGVPNLYQIILKSTATIGGETDQPRPEGEPYNRIYYNRVTVPIIFLDYVDREADDISICYDGSLTLQDDDNFKKSGRVLPLVEPSQMAFANFDNMEIPASPNAKWRVFSNPFAFVEQTTDPELVIRGNGSLLLSSVGDGAVAAAVGRETPTTSGRFRVRFNLQDGKAAVVLFCMLQGADPLVDPSYHVIIKSSAERQRIALVKGPIDTSEPIPLKETSWAMVPGATNLAAQLEWKVDLPNNRIRLRVYLAGCETDDFGGVVRRMDIFDTDAPYLTSMGEGFGFRPAPGAIGAGDIVVDDPEVLKELNPVQQSNPARIG